MKLNIDVYDFDFAVNSSTKRKKTKERDNKNNDCNQTWLQKAKQHNILQFLQL
jgi:hypothetical protein